MSFCKKNALIFWALSNLLLFVCCNKMIEKKIQNHYYDDSLLALYIPNSILDSTNSKKYLFGEREGFITYNSRKADSNIYILVEYSTLTYDLKELPSENIIGKLKGKQKEILNDWNFGNSKIFSTTIEHNKYNNLGIIKANSFIRDSTFLTVICVFNKYKNRWYNINIFYDNTMLGNSLRDSIQLINESIEVRKKFVQ